MNKTNFKKMKRLLLPLLAALALPIYLVANWLGDETFYLLCDVPEYKVVKDGLDWFGGWQKVNSGDFGLFTLNEKDKTASLLMFTTEDGLKYHGVDVVFLNKDSIKLSQKVSDEVEKDHSFFIYTINRINGEFHFWIEDEDTTDSNNSLTNPSDDTYILNRGNCRVVEDGHLF